jgi:NADPH:quinone reductase-like Zn-dependent oxidoreductase
MRAAVFNGYGPPEVVHVAEVEKPAPRDGELLVKVHATTVNRTDCGYRRADPFVLRLWTGLVRPTRQPILGTEFAGEVEAAGPGVTSFSVGDRVFGYVEGTFGAHAGYLTIAEAGSLAVIPAGLTYEEAAPATEGAHYAISSLLRAKVRSGQDVLVNGATGAIGSAAVQLLTAVGVRVTAVCDTPNVELVRGLGADKVVDYTAADFTDDDRRYDIVFDAVGKSSFGRCRRLLRPGGTYVSSDLGPWLQNTILPLVTPLAARCFDRKKVVFPYPEIDQAMVRRFARLMESGAFRPVIDRRYPLDDIVEAYRYVETGQKIGNVVIVVEHGSRPG